MWIFFHFWLFFNIHFFLNVVLTLQSFNECLSSMQRLSQTEDPTLNSKAKQSTLMMMMMVIGPRHCWSDKHKAASLPPTTKMFLSLLLFLKKTFFFVVHLLQSWREKNKFNKTNKKKNHKLGVLCMTFCYSRYGVHVSAALCMMELDEDFVLDTKGKKETVVKDNAMWESGDLQLDYRLV